MDTKNQSTEQKCYILTHKDKGCELRFYADASKPENEVWDELAPVLMELVINPFDWNFTGVY